MTVLEKKQLPDKNGCLVYDMKIKCLGKRPASGYLTIPKNAKAKSLPIRMIYQGYSYEGAQTVTANPKEITFRVNAHGIPNGMPASYYAKLGNTELRDKVEKTLLEMAEDGTVLKIAKEWGLEDQLCIGK